MPERVASAKALPRPECRSTSSRWRPTSCRSTSVPTAAGAIERLKERGVLVSTTVHPTIVRAVTHLDISDDDIDAALEAIPAALGATRTEVPLER